MNLKHIDPYIIPPAFPLNHIFDGNYQFIPHNMIPSRFLKFCIEGFDVQMDFSNQDPTLHVMTELLVCQLRKLIELFGEKNIFSEPYIFFQPKFGMNEARIGFKIGMMEKEDYLERVKALKKKKK